MKKIIYSRPDGILCVCHPAPQAKLKDETEEAFLARVIERSVPSDAVGVRIVEHTEIPSDRYFRNAWKDTGSALTVDMPKAREVHRDRLRQIRKPKLEALDVEALRSLTNATKLAEIEAKKQALRDATAYAPIDAATTPEALKLAVPSCLA